MMMMMKARRIKPRGKCVASLTDVMKIIYKNFKWNLFYKSHKRADLMCLVAEFTDDFISYSDVYDEKFDFYA